MEEEPTKEEPWPTYRFEVLDQPGHYMNRLGYVDIQAQTYEDAMRQVLERIRIVCAVQKKIS